ncbi:hypothetical protein PTKIN_Ptkin12aG0037700 [Pterospermum kingtungense]
MADALLSALVNTILENINSLWVQELGITGGLKTELENLQSTLSTIQAVLMDAEEKQWKSEAIKNWLRKLEDTAYHIDDLLDEFAVNTPRGTQVISFPKQILFRSKMAHKLKDARQKLDAIAGERSKFHLTEAMETAVDRDVDREWRQTSSLVNESEVYGREKELEEMRNRLLSNVADQDAVSVYTICGMGGLGKTTLAQLIYNDQSIKNTFDLRIWVCVSDDFDIIRLTKAIMESIGGMCSIQELDPLQRHLQEKLMGKKFLLVLDDVWNEYHDKWEGLKEAFRCGASGSAVIVTTRIEKVALMMTTTPVFHLGCLSEDDSWTLFKQRAFRTRKSEDHPQLEEIGKEIVKKCGRVPLAIKALGSLMCFKEGESEWLSIKESKMWELADEGSKVLSVLRLSYMHLKPHLRQCFTFCCIFPKDSIMNRQQLVQLWMANGFVPSRGQMNLHDLGCEIFNELVWRSFFQEVKEDYRGELTCKMHDLMHDLAESIMRYECHVIEPAGDRLAMPETVRHMCIRSNVGNVPRSCSLRSLMVRNNACLRISPKQKHLRALHFSHCGAAIKISFDNFKHLRCLNFSFSGIKTLSESLCNLHNLQTLNLAYCRMLKMLPKGMKRLKNLIYLDIRECYQLTYMPVGLGQLSCLRVLSMFIVGKDPGCCIDELKGMTLEGELCIKELDNVKGLMDAKNANLVMKRNLRTLSLSWRGNNDSHPDENAEQVLSGLQPNSSLKDLTIQNYHGARFSFWLMDLLVPNLEVISLEYCKRCECLPPLGKLRFLKELTISGMDALKSIDNSFYGDGDISFPSLESLSFFNMLGLVEWTTVAGREDFPHLSSLSIVNCPNLVELPTVHSLKTLRIEDSNVQLLSFVMHFTYITSLQLHGFPELAVLPNGLLQNHKQLEHLSIRLKSLKSLSDLLDNLSALKRLNIQHCLELESLPVGIKHLSSLQTLRVDDCTKLASLSDGVRYLTSLRGLFINGCPELNSLLQNIQHLSALRSLEICGCEGLTSLPKVIEYLSSLDRLDLISCNSLVTLPENGLRGLSSLSSFWLQNCDKLASLSDGVRYLTSLQHLLINGCPELNSLPQSIQHLSALRSLRIRNCRGLTSLPNEIEHLTSLSLLEIHRCPNLMCLPQGLQSLTALKALTIVGCPHLKRRCNKGRGEDWPIIAHIPSFKIMSYEEYWGGRRSQGSLLTRVRDCTYGLSRKLFRSQS